jgi:hypothetical protein
LGDIRGDGGWCACRRGGCEKRCSEDGCGTHERGEDSAGWCRVGAGEWGDVYGWDVCYGTETCVGDKAANRVIQDILTTDQDDGHGVSVFGYAARRQRVAYQFFDCSPYELQSLHHFSLLLNTFPSYAKLPGSLSAY